MAPTAGTVTACRYDDPSRDGWRRITLLSHDRYCDEVINQTDLLRKVVEGADLSVTVPTTPDWTLAQLLRHIGGNLRASEAAVRTCTPPTPTPGCRPSGSSSSARTASPGGAVTTRPPSRCAARSPTSCWSSTGGCHQTATGLRCSATPRCWTSG